MSDETTLLPCPWCGVDMKLHAINYPWADGEPCWTIWHEDIGEAIKRKCPMEMGSYGTREEAIAAWNTRAELGSGTCCIVKTPSDSDFSDDWRYRCSECGCNIPVNERDPETGDVINAANFCPNCGKRVSA